MASSYADHLNEKIEILYITLSTLQQQQQNNSITTTSSAIATTTTNNVDKLIMIINDIEKYKSTHMKYLENRTTIKQQQHHQQPSSSLCNDIYDRDHDLPHLNRDNVIDNNNHLQLPTASTESEAVAVVVNDVDDDYTLVNEVLNDCYKKCATFIRSPYTEQLRNLISSSRKKLQMKASQGRLVVGWRVGKDVG